jgi:hypothetical protein
MRKGKILLLVLAAFTFIFSSCLTVEKKTYTYEFTGKSSGKLTIKYYNIMSIVDSAGVKEIEDFDALVNDYINGDKITTSYPDAQNIQKRLFEEDGVLCGEVTMDFANLAAARLFQFDKKSPYAFYVSSVDGETYVESNGTYGGDVCPIAMFPSKMKKLVITTSVSKPSDDTYVSLLKEFVKWKKQ